MTEVVAILETVVLLQRLIVALLVLGIGVAVGVGLGVMTRLRRIEQQHGPVLEKAGAALRGVEAVRRVEAARRPHRSGSPEAPL